MKSFRQLKWLLLGHLATAISQPLDRVGPLEFPNLAGVTAQRLDLAIEGSADIGSVVDVLSPPE